MTLLSASLSRSFLHCRSQCHTRSSRFPMMVMAVSTSGPPEPPALPPTLPPVVPALPNLPFGLSRFYEVMSFTGSAPEIINGRLAMVGFLAAASAEEASEEGVLQQLSEAWPEIAAVVLLVTVASLIPILSGNPKREAFGVFTPLAEILNGRMAMVGFGTLLLLEACFQGSAFFLKDRILLCTLMTSLVAVEFTLSDTLTKIQAVETDDEVISKAHANFLEARGYIEEYMD